MTRLGVALLFLLSPQDPKLPEAELIHEDAQGGADSAVSPDGSLIAYSSRQSGNLDLWLVDVKTRKPRRLTTHAATDFEPRWHPDGSKVVFTTDRNGNKDVYEIDIKTGEEKALAISAFNEDYPSYSADGKQIIYTSGPWIGREIYVKDLDGGDAKQITKGHRLCGAGSLSPDGKQAVYHVYYKTLGFGESDLFLVDAGGGEGNKLTDDAIWDYKPCWSPDGKWIAFSSKRSSKSFDVWIISPDGKTLRQITGWPDTDERWPNWTSDGRICFHRIVPSKGRVVCIDRDGKVTRGSPIEGSISNIAVDAKGRIACSANGTIYVMGPEPKAVARGSEVAWLPDSDLLVFKRGGKIWSVEPGKEPAAYDKPIPEATVSLCKIAELEGKHVLSKEDRVLLTSDYRLLCPVVSGDTVWCAENEPLRVQYWLTKEAVK